MSTTSSISKHNIFRFGAILFILTQTLPPFRMIVSLPNDYIHAIFLVMGVILFPEILQKKSIIYLFVYLIIAFVFFILGNEFYGGIGTVTGPLCYMTAGLFLWEYALKYDSDYKFTKSVVLVMIMANVFMTIISIPTIMAMPNILRFAFSASTKDDFVGVSRWLISYNTCHGLVFLFPALILLCRKYYQKKKKQIWFWLISTVLLFIIVYLSNATTAFLMATLITLLSLFLRRERFDNRMIGSIIISGVFIAVFSSASVMIPVLDFIQENMDESWSNYHKIEDIKYRMLYGEETGDMGHRVELYESSLTLFLESPLTGTSHPEKIGQHSWFVDRLACLGVFLIIPLVLVFVYHIKSVFHGIKGSKVTYLLGLMAFLLMLFLKNDFGPGTWLYGFAFLPLLCRYADYVDENK